MKALSNVLRQREPTESNPMHSSSAFMNTVICAAAVTAFSATAQAAGERAQGTWEATLLARTAGNDRPLAATRDATRDATRNIAWIRGWRLTDFDELGTSLADADGFAARSSIYADLSWPQGADRGPYSDGTPAGDTYAAALAQKRDVPGVSEPQTFALMLAGLGCIGLLVRRRSR